MADESAESQLCRQCRGALGERRVTIAEWETTSTVVIDWTFCSWACARELVIRMVRVGRDER